MYLPGAFLFADTPISARMTADLEWDIPDWIPNPPPNPAPVPLLRCLYTLGFDLTVLGFLLVEGGAAIAIVSTSLVVLFLEPEQPIPTPNVW